MKRAYAATVLVIAFPFFMIEEVLRAFYGAWKGLHIVHDIKYGFCNYKRWWNANMNKEVK